MNAIKLTGPFALLGQSLRQYRQFFSPILRIFALPVVLWLLVALLETAPLGKLFSPLVGIVAVVASVISQIALIVLLARHDDTKLAATISPTKRLILPFIWIAILSSLVLFGATILLVIPGLIFGIWLSQAMYLMVAENERGLRALAMSWSRTRGYWWAIFGRTLVLCLTMIVAIIVLAIILNLIGNQAMVGFIMNAIQFLVFTPIAAIYTYQLYREIRTVKTATPPTDSDLATKRKWLVGLSLFGLLLPVAVALIVITSLGYVIIK